MKYCFDRAELEELRLLRQEAERLGTDPDCFISRYLGLTLAEWQVYLATGQKPTGHYDE